MNIKLILTMIKNTFSSWSEDNALRLAAALAFYAILSLAPLLTIVIAISGFVFGQEAARGQIVAQVRGLVGDQSAQVIQTIIENAHSSGGSTLATLVGVVTLILGATGMFVQLREAMNIIWGIKPRQGRGIKGAIINQISPFAMVIGLGFLLIVLLAISAWLAAISSYISGIAHGYSLLLQAANFFISFIALTFIFIMIFKFVPDAEVGWEDVWIGAAITSVLFIIGRFLMAIYLSHSSVGSVYGVASSLVILLLWIYYSANILLVGAEFTQVYADAMGSRIVPKKGASSATPEMKAQHRMGQPKKGSSASSGASSAERDGEGSHHVDHGLLDRAISEAFYLRSLWKRYRK